jgi:hypothetical protein
MNSIEQVFFFKYALKRRDEGMLKNRWVLYTDCQARDRLDIN